MCPRGHTVLWRTFFSSPASVNRRGLETGPQAKKSKSERSATTLFSSLFFRRVRATRMTQCRVENTRVHLWTFSPVSVKCVTYFSRFSSLVYSESFFTRMGIFSWYRSSRVKATSWRANNKRYFRLRILVSYSYGKPKNGRNFRWNNNSFSKGRNENF